MNNRRKLAGWLFRHAPWSLAPKIARQMYRIAAGMLPEDPRASETKSAWITVSTGIPTH